MFSPIKIRKCEATFTRYFWVLAVATGRNVNDESSWNIDEVSVGNGYYSCENGFIQIDSNEKVCVGGCD